MQDETLSINESIRKISPQHDRLQECSRQLRTDGDKEQEEEPSQVTKPYMG